MVFSTMCIFDGGRVMTSYEYSQLQNMLTDIQDRKPEYFSCKYQEGYKIAILKMKSMVHSFYNSHKNANGSKYFQDILVEMQLTNVRFVKSCVAVIITMLLNGTIVHAVQKWMKRRINNERIR